MKRTLRSALALGLAVMLGAPLSAQQTTTRFPPLERAEKGDYVDVTLRDGREIRGEVGKWVDDVDIVSIRAAASGRELLLPLRKQPSRLSTATAVSIGVLATLGVLLALGAAMGSGG